MIGFTCFISTIVLVGQYRLGKILDGNGLSIALIVTMTIFGVLSFVCMTLWIGITRGVDKFLAERKIAALDHNPFSLKPPALSRGIYSLLIGLPAAGTSRWSEHRSEAEWHPERL